MIQANELRIGNYVYDIGGQPSKVVRLTEEKIPLASPIPLTPEILEKAGFIDIPNNDGYRDMRLKLKNEITEYELIITGMAFLCFIKSY